MRKKILVICSLVFILLTGCDFSGYDWVDTNYHFDYAYIQLPNGVVVEGEIASWSDSEDGEQLTITFKDGTRYLCSSYNCVLVEN